MEEFINQYALVADIFKPIHVKLKVIVYHHGST